MNRVGLLLGSFNPVHNGHLAIARHALIAESLSEIWFVVSPHNPLKEMGNLAPEAHRLKMVEIALQGSNLPMSPCSIEFGMPRPSFTIDTLFELRKVYPDYRFYPIIGSDSLASIEKWKDFSRLLSEFEVLVYPREGFNFIALAERYGVKPIHAPLFNVSSTHIRESIQKGNDCSALVPAGVLNYIISNRLYQSESA